MASISSALKKLSLAALAAVTIGGATAVSTAPAEAQWGYRHYHGGWGGHYRPAYYGGWRGYYRPAYYGGWGGYYRPYRPYYGGAVAAGLIGGLALGAFAARPAYYPAAYGYYPRPYYRRVVYGGRCWVERRVRFNRWGDRIVRRVRVCG